MSELAGFQLEILPCSSEAGGLGSETEVGIVASLFIPVVPEEKLSPLFRRITERGFLAARVMMDKTFSKFSDVDGNFIEQFQTSGFSARTWELYLFAYFSESGLNVSRPKPTPDFLVCNSSSEVLVEAVTANPQAGGTVVSHPAQLPMSVDELEPWNDWLAIRMGSALYSKVVRRYWDLPHVRGKPLVLAIENFSADTLPGILGSSLMFSDSALTRYLYGMAHDWRLDEAGNLEILPRPISAHNLGDLKSIPSGFFRLPETSEISAVMFSNSGTVTKFNRMGYLQGTREPNVVMVRTGAYYDHDPNAIMPLRFTYKVGDSDWPETWGQGVSVMHNPYAKYPVPRGFFPEAAEHRLGADGRMWSLVPDFHPLASMTAIVRGARDHEYPGREHYKPR